MRFATWALALVLLLLGVSGLHAEETGTVALAVRGDRLTLRAVDAPLVVILQRLAEATGIAIYIKGPVYERVSVELANVSLEEGIRRLLKHQNSAFLSTTSPGTLAAIYVLGPHGGTIASPTAQPASASAVAAAPTPDGEVDVEAARRQMRLKINDLEETLRAASVAHASEASVLLQDLMADPDHSVRITALQWLAGKGDSGVEALATALSDGDDLVQRAALQIILDHGASAEAIEEVRAAAEATNDKAVHQMLSRLLAQ